MDLFYSLPNELLCKIAEPLDAGRLSVLAAIDRRLRKIVKSELHSRVYFYLSIFIPKEKIPILLNTLTATSSVIGGSVAQAAITPSIFYEDDPGNLNIFVPDGLLAYWEVFLKDNFNFLVSDRRPYQNMLLRTISSMTIHGENAGPRIVLSESSSSASITPVIGSPFTSQMNFLTANHLYSIYPRFTMNLKSFQIRTAPLILSKRNARMAYASLLEKRGVKAIDDDEQRTLCDSAKFCPNVVRFIGMELEGRERLDCDDIGIMCWGDDNKEENFLEKKQIRFWLGGYCVNNHN